MPRIDTATLSTISTHVMEAAKLTHAEQAEVLRIAQGFACKDSAAVADLALETVRTRRKKIYRKLKVSGSNELLSVLLAVSLARLCGGEQVSGHRAPAVSMAPAASTSPRGP